MSVEHIRLAFSAKMTPTNKLVFVALADCANDSGECFPSNQFLIDKTGLSKRAVQNAVKFLTENGYISSQKRFGRSTVFVISAKENWGTSAPKKTETDSAEGVHSVHGCTTCAGGCTTCAGGCTTCTGGCTTCTHNHNLTIKNHKEPYVARASAEPVDNFQPVDNLIPDKPPDKPTEVRPAVALAIALRKAGLLCNAADPRVIALADGGVSPETALAALEEAKKSKPDERIALGYVVKILERWAMDAKRMDVRGADKRDPPDNWWASDAGIDRKGRELGLMPRPMESYSDYRTRIHDEIRKRKEAVHET